jgi:hypothetical protein
MWTFRYLSWHQSKQNQGRTFAKVDSGAFRIRADKDVYKQISDVPIEHGREACAADGSALSDIGSGRIQISLWGEDLKPWSVLCPISGQESLSVDDSS